MALFLMLILAICFLAYANGANDNCKGVATLFGSGTTDYLTAIRFATVTTFAGSVSSVFLADKLLKNFSGKGLVPDIVATSPEFLLAVSLGAGATVLIAAIRGFPISTTHGLTGALLGAGIMAVGMDVNFMILGNAFFLPLLLSPLIAVMLGAAIYLLFHALRHYLGITREYCLCIGEHEVVIPVPQPAAGLSVNTLLSVDTVLDTEEHCSQRYYGHYYGFNLQKLVDYAHYLSAGTVCFARGLNDTPKIVAILLAAKALEINTGLILVGAAIAVGGMLNAQKVAETMSKKITPINHGQGFTANLVTGMLVIFASRLGIPVSTTHVSVGSIFGIGLITKKANLKIITEILLSWILTLPIAAFLSGMIYLGFKHF